jgi:hypothetical protein
MGRTNLGKTENSIVISVRMEKELYNYLIRKTKDTGLNLNQYVYNLIVKDLENDIKR